MRCRAILLILILLSGIPVGGLASLPTSDSSSGEWSVTNWSAQSQVSARDGDNGTNGSGNGSGEEGSNGTNISTATTSAVLALAGNFSATTTVNGTWSAYLASDLSVGSDLLNASTLRLDQYIDLHLGDNDSNLSLSV